MVITHKQTDAGMMVVKRQAPITLPLAKSKVELFAKHDYPFKFPNKVKAHRARTAWVTRWLVTLSLLLKIRATLATATTAQPHLTVFTTVLHDVGLWNKLWATALRCARRIAIALDTRWSVVIPQVLTRQALV